MGSEKYPVDGIECHYDRDNYREAYQEKENFYRLHTETNLLRLFIDLHKFRTKYKMHKFRTVFMCLTYPNKKIILPVNQLD